MCHTNEVESVVFNIGLDEMRSDSNPSVQSGHHSYAGIPAVLGASHFLIKYQVCHASLVQSKKETLSNLSSGFIPSQMPENIFLNN